MFTDQEMATALQVLLDIRPTTPYGHEFLLYLQKRITPQRTLSSLHLLIRDLKQWVTHHGLTMTPYESTANLSEQQRLYLLNYIMS